MRTKVQAWLTLTPEAHWARTRNAVIRHSLRHALLFALGCAILCFDLWQAVRATTVLGVIVGLANTAFMAAFVWYLWRVRQDAHLSDPPSWWRPRPRVPPRS